MKKKNQLITKNIYFKVLKKKIFEKTRAYLYVSLTFYKRFLFFYFYYFNLILKNLFYKKINFYYLINFFKYIQIYDFFKKFTFKYYYQIDFTNNKFYYTPTFMFNKKIIFFQKLFFFKNYNEFEIFLTPTIYFVKNNLINNLALKYLLLLYYLYINLILFIIWKNF